MDSAVRACGWPWWASFQHASLGYLSGGFSFDRKAVALAVHSGDGNLRWCARDHRRHRPFAGVSRLRFGSIWLRGLFGHFLDLIFLSTFVGCAFFRLDCIEPDFKYDLFLFQLRNGVDLIL